MFKNHYGACIYLTSAVCKFFFLISCNIIDLYMHIACNSMCMYTGTSKLQVIKNAMGLKMSFDIRLTYRFNDTLGQITPTTYSNPLKYHHKI